MGLGRWAVYLCQERDRHRRRGPLGFLFVSISRVPAARVVGGACRVSWSWVFFGDAGKEEKGNGRGREEKSLVGRECGGLVWFTERRRTGTAGRAGGSGKETRREEALNWGAEGDAGPCTGLLASQNSAARGRWGGHPPGPAGAAGSSASPAGSGSGRTGHLTGQPGWLFPSWLGAGALTGLWVAGAALGQWRPPNDPVGDG